VNAGFSPDRAAVARIRIMPAWKSRAATTGRRGSGDSIGRSDLGRSVERLAHHPREINLAIVLGEKQSPGSRRP